MPERYQAFIIDEDAHRMFVLGEQLQMQVNAAREQLQFTGVLPVIFEPSPANKAVLQQNQFPCEVFANPNRETENDPNKAKRIADFIEKHRAEIALIFMDLDMPGVSGPEIVDALTDNGETPRPDLIFGFHSTFAPIPDDKQRRMKKVKAAAKAQLDEGPVRFGIKGPLMPGDPKLGELAKFFIPGNQPQLQDATQDFRLHLLGHR